MAYTWRDGDRTLTALLQDDLTVSPDGEIALRQDAAGGTAGRDTARSDTPGKGEAGDGLPVFRSPTGSLMTLPGGVLLALDEEWSEGEVAAFFAANGIAAGRVSALDYVVNGFLVETEPGWASLELANALAEQEGVEVSSPNWWQERVPR